MGYDVVGSGYVSMDHMIKISSPAQVGYTSIVTNADNGEIYYGGCAVNVCAALGKLGFRAAPILRVGYDFESNGFKSFLETSNVCLDGVSRIENEITSACYLVQDNRNDHITLYYPGSMDRKYANDIPDNFFQDTKYGLITVASRDDNRYFLNKCKKYNVPIVFGMKDDFDAFPVAFLKEILMESSIVFMNEAERDIILKLFGCSTITELFKIGKARVVVVTLGKEGSICYEKTETDVLEYKLGICSVSHVVDATGAGDAYISGFLYGMLKNRKIRDCCALGAALSSFVLSAVGACTCLPKEEELEEKAKELN
ncbi:MAG: PfkB family carbohydrate kinase [Lachnospiraceae bacterium]|nr:PfkB family carbohydrate kinase [Lachnospiraceae bacterium]